MITVAIRVEDHPLMCEVLAHLLYLEQDYDVIAAAADAPESLVMAWRTQPDIVLMDINLPGLDGIEATRAVLTPHPAGRIVMLSASCCKTLIRATAGAGPCGDPRRQDSPHHLCERLRAAARGENLLHRRRGHYRTPFTTRAPSPRGGPLVSRSSRRGARWVDES